MTRSSWGTKTKISKNKWRIRWCEWDGRDRVRRSRTLYPCTSREADDELRRLWQLHHLRPEEREVPCPTFQQCWDDWYLPELNDRVSKGELADNTRRVYLAQWKHIGNRWGATPMDKVDVNEYQVWLKTLRPSTASLANITAGNMVNCAKLHGVKGITFKDVAYKMPKKEEKGAKKELEVYTVPELHDLMEQVRGRSYESICILMGIGSCRVGEASAASVDDMAFETYNGRVYAVYDLHHQYGYNDQGFMTLKTKESYRPIIVPEPWSLRLAEIAEQKKADNELYMADRGNGMPIPRDMVNRIWRKDFSSGSITVRYLPMTKLRNSWATAMLWKYNVPAQMVDKMMGHASKNILGKNYDRPDKQMFIETVDRIYFG